MKKHINVDVIPFLREAMLRNTEHYQTDFDSDVKIITKAAKSEYPEDKVLLWMSRPCGTWCFMEHNVFVKGSFEHNTWTFYAEQTADKIAAFAIVLSEAESNSVKGDVYELDYPAHAAKVTRLSALPMGERKVFADGFEDIFSFKVNRYTLQKAIAEHGEIIRSVSILYDQSRLDEILARQALERM